MLQFYKSQFEAAQERIQVQERVIKRQKREIAHVENVARQMQGRLHEARLEINHLTDSNQTLRDQLIDANNERVIMDNARNAAEYCTLRFMELIEKILKDHPEAESQYCDEAAEIAQAGLNIRLMAGIPLVNTLHDDEETETESESED